ncbi:MAG: glycosyltransferase family 2 protein [Anaerolineae bacterium]|nr:glycosyltransferase family 2 protein [Anaerolineae bacterium]MCB9130070.1 glycosyltransferase family 2 protein [Anaerolineales bacterium]MCB0229229.1 glycosyltransferase family 2 protein [Anaerolineae bacterium]MCB0232629.1 glycosyltransferase family 2 protein [Anaerolineae bacterium]MCB0241212.1 glycosyltransferase family 2 protein [Anaerolineae bacterium]
MPPETPFPHRLIIMPAHNEAGNLPRVIAEIRVAAPGYDLVVIDDGSTDRTAAVAASLGAAVVTLPVNLGYGGAVQTGFRYAVRHDYDLAVVMDADGQHDPAGVNLLANAVDKGEVDVAVGSRFRGRMDYHQPWVKRIGMSVFAWTVSRITRREVTDPTSGYQALNRAALRFFAYDNYPSDYPDADTLLVLHYAGFRVSEIPVTMRERISGVSMHSGWKPIYYVLKMWLAIGIVLLRQGTHASAHRVD